MDHAYTLSGSQIQQRLLSVNADGRTQEDDEDEDMLDDVQEDEGNNDYENENNPDHMYGEDSMEGEGSGDDNLVNELSEQAFTVKLPTEEWMQMLPPHYLLHYIRERTVFRESGRAVREGRETYSPLKRGWLQGAWRETLKDAITKQTGIPCVINFHSSNFLKQPFSRKVGAPLWRVRACCRQDDGQCLRFSMKIQDFHPSKPHVELVVTTEGTLMEGPEGERRHTFTASDHIRAIKSMQRYSLTTSQSSPNGVVASEASVENTQDDSAIDDEEVQRFKLSVPMQEWISFLPAEAAEAYLLERSRVSKDRLTLESQDAWSRGSRLFVPRVTKECRQYLKRALAEHTGLPCRIGLTGRCHLKPPFSRKKRAPLFVTNGFCGRKDHKCLRFKFTVQDFDPQESDVTVDVEVRGQLLTGLEGNKRHDIRRSVEDVDGDAVPPEAVKRTASDGPGSDGEGQAKRRKGRLSSKKSASSAATTSDVYAEAVQALQSETWPVDFDLQSAEVVLDEGKVAAQDGAGMVQVLSEGGTETTLGEEAARELMQLANEALSLAGDGSSNTQFTATKIVQSGDQVFIFVSDPDDDQSGAPPVIEAVEVNSDEIAGLAGVVSNQHSENLLTQYGTTGTPQEAEPDEDSPCMEYRWEMQIAMAEWLRLLPPKSLRYYIHERTVGREVWVEEGWEKQFRCQTLQQGWRDVIRRAVVEQTDIPCQVCFRGRSSLKLPFSRKYSAALWRTQGYCAKGDRHCLIYKFCVQDFHPDDEAVTVQVYAVGKLHRDCRRWFNGVGTPVTENSKTWAECEAELGLDNLRKVQDEGGKAFDELLRQVKKEPLPEPEEEEEGDEGGGGDADGDAHYSWETTTDQQVHDELTEHEDPEEQAVDTEQDVEVSTSESGSAGEEVYQAVLKGIETLKTSLFKARRCPLRMQAALRLVRNAESLASARCSTADCLCQPSLPRLKCSPAKLQHGDDTEPQAETEPTVPPEPQPAVSNPPRVVISSSPPPLTAIAMPPLTPRPSQPQVRPLTLQTKVTARPGPVVVTAVTAKPVETPVASPRPKPGQPTIIKLTAAEIAVQRAQASASPRTSSKLVKLSTAIERSALRTSSVIGPVASSPSATAVPKATSTPAGVTGISRLQPVSQPQVSSSQDRAKRTATATVTTEPHAGDDGADPSWIMDEMRSVIMDVDESGETAPVAKKSVKETPATPATPTVTGRVVRKVTAAASSDSQDRPVRAKPSQASPTRLPQRRPLSPPSRPVTRGTKVIVSTASVDNPPPLVPISKGNSSTKTPTSPSTSSSKGSQIVFVDSSGKTIAPPTSPQPAKSPTRSVQTRLLTSAEKAAFAKGGKVLILKPSMPILRSSTRKAS